jgi:hypothetical protein
VVVVKHCAVCSSESVCAGACAVSVCGYGISEVSRQVRDVNQVWVSLRGVMNARLGTYVVSTDRHRLGAKKSGAGVSC